MTDVVVYAIVAETIAGQAMSGKAIIRFNKEDPMSDVVLSLTVFHAVAAVAVFGLMVFSALKVVQERLGAKG